jgi:nucleotide-binding universal stress UspA family protein
MSTRTAARPVVVGVDGSDAGQAPLGWAAGDCRRRRAPLCVVHAMDQRHSEPFVRANPVFVGEERRAAEEVLATAVDRVRACAPQLDVRPVLDDRAPAVALLRYAESAALVVVGSRGRGGFAGLLLGSTSLHVAMHAPGPVVVVRPPTGGRSPGSSTGRIVVGIDGSPQSTCAVRFAVERADVCGSGLTALRVRKSQHTRRHDRALPADCLDPWRRRHPDVDVEEKTVVGNVGSALVDESAGADLLVVGSRGRGGFSGLLLGSVSHACLHHAHCPVAVVRC